ncbi:hypothetical protein BDZ97DRAFT_1760684 [Flammula alnicola]|nr:hypothetical protein BDZ97DRAFT_1760684 [Flammula alnicola]
MFSFQEVPPFFEPGAPPPTLPILIAQTEVGKMQSLTKLLAEEEIGTGSVHHQPSSVRFAPYPNPAKQKMPSPPTAPSKKPPPARSKQLATARSTSDSTSQKSSSSDSDSDSDDDGNKYVKKLVVDQLEPTKNFSSQSVVSLTSVRVMAVQKFPALRGYAACWPVTDLCWSVVVFTISLQISDISIPTEELTETCPPRVNEWKDLHLQTKWPTDIFPRVPTQRCWSHMM